MNYEDLLVLETMNSAYEFVGLMAGFQQNNQSFNRLMHRKDMGKVIDKAGVMDNPKFVSKLAKVVTSSGRSELTSFLENELTDMDIQKVGFKRIDDIIEILEVNTTEIAKNDKSTIITQWYSNPTLMKKFFGNNPIRLEIVLPAFGKPQVTVELES